MNDLSDTIGLLRREVRDVRAVVTNLGHRSRKAETATIDRPGGLIARLAACALLAKCEKRQPDDVARQYFRGDHELTQLITRAASGPATTGGAGFAAELVGTVVTDIATNLLPQSALTQLRAASPLGTRSMAMA